MLRVLIRIGGGFLLLVLAVAIYAGWRLAERGGLFVSLDHVAIAGCTLVPAAAGAEDIEIDPATGWVFVSAHDRRAVAAGELPRGAILAAHVDRLGGGFVELTAPGLPGALPTLGPHGISLYSGPEGARLAVVNHHSLTLTTIELFAIDYADDDSSVATPSLRHLRSIASDLFTGPNDVVLVGPETFYATNDHRYPTGLMSTVETYLILDIGSLVYGEGENVRLAAGGLSYGNGVNVSPDGKVIYVAETTDGVLRVYDRDIASGDLALRPGKQGRIAVGRGPDNIEVTPDGAVWIAGHPAPLKLPPHGADPARRSPSEIVRLRVDEAGQPGAPETIYLDDGAQFSGASSAVPFAGRLIAGSVYGDMLLSCPLEAP